MYLASRGVVTPASRGTASTGLTPAHLEPRAPRPCPLLTSPEHREGPGHKAANPAPPLRRGRQGRAQHQGENRPAHGTDHLPRKGQLTRAIREDPGLTACQHKENWSAGFGGVPHETPRAVHKRKSPDDRPIIGGRSSGGRGEAPKRNLRVITFPKGGITFVVGVQRSPGGSGQQRAASGRRPK